MIAFAAVVGLMAVRAALMDVSLMLIGPLLAASVVLILVNGIITSRLLRRARDEIESTSRQMSATPMIWTATAATALAVISLLLLLQGAPSS
jgi:hypothetical protein